MTRIPRIVPVVPSLSRKETKLRQKAAKTIARRVDKALIAEGLEE